MRRLIILGAGGFGKVVADIAQQSGAYPEIVFLDDSSQGYKVIGECQDYKQFADGETEMYPAFGKNELRLEWITRLQQEQISVATLIHKSAYVSPRTEIGIGSVVMPGAVVNTNTKVGQGCIVNCNAVIDHDCVLEDGVHICLNATVKAQNRIAKETKIEAGTVIENCAYPL